MDCVPNSRHRFKTSPIRFVCLRSALSAGYGSRYMRPNFSFWMTKRHDKLKQPCPIHDSHRRHEENLRRVKKNANDGLQIILLTTTMPSSCDRRHHAVENSKAHQSTRNLRQRIDHQGFQGGIRVHQKSLSPRDRHHAQGSGRARTTAPA